MGLNSFVKLVLNQGRTYFVIKSRETKFFHQFWRKKLLEIRLLFFKTTFDGIFEGARIGAFCQSLKMDKIGVWDKVG